jgi:hypothetical protein
MKTLPLLALAAVAGVSSLTAQTVAAPFNPLYSITNVGTIPGLGTTYGGIAFDLQNPNKLLCGNWATIGSQNLFSVDVVRDAQGHVTGFAGPATPIGQADHLEAGLSFHPSGVLFYSRYPSGLPSNQVGQFKPGSTVPDRTDPILGPSWLGGLQVVPDGLPGAGLLKTLRWSGGQWTSAQLVPDGLGTFNIVGETQTAILTGGPDGFCYVPSMAPLFTGADVLVAEFSSGNLAAYSIDINGDPIVSTRQLFISGLSSAFALTVDPVTQDILHAKWSLGTIHVIQGFGSPCGQCSNYGTGLAGTGGVVPRTTWFGCALGGYTTGVHVGNALPNGIGVMSAGFTQQSIPIFGGTLLNEAAVLLTLFASPAGNASLPLPVPVGVNGLSLYFQAGFLDPGAVQGISFSNGVALVIP